jgi:ribose transport system substrate-binding protein
MLKSTSVILIILLTGTLLLSACASSAPPTTGESIIIPANTGSPENGQEATLARPPDTPVVALIMKTLTNPFFVEMEKGARRAEAELGIELLVKTGAQETSIEQQISIIKDLIQDQVDAIVIAPADSQELVPVLAEAQAAGIVIINIDNQLNPEISAELGLIDVPYISVDNEQGAYLSAGYLSRQISSPTEIIVLEGIRSAQNAQDRKAGAMRAFAENDNIDVVASESANWKIDEAYHVISDLYEEHPDVGAVFCSNDMMAFGVMNFLQETGRPEVLVAAYDALEEAKEAIKAGNLLATIDQQAAEQGYTGVQFAVKALEGETLPLETIIEVKLVTKDTLE